MIKPVQIHTRFAFDVRRHQDGPPISLAVKVTTNGIDENGKELTVDQALAIHMHTMKELEEGNLAETVEQRGVKILMSQAEYSKPDVVPPPTHEQTRP